MMNQQFIMLDNVKPDNETNLSQPLKHVRCYQTSTPKVTNVCHHCGRFLSLASDVKPRIYQNHTLELTPMLRAQEAQAVHCKTHAHYLPYSPLKILIIPGLLLMSGSGYLLWRVFLRAYDLGVGDRTIRAFEQLSFLEALVSILPLVSATWAASFVGASLFIMGLLLLTIGLNQYRIFRARAMSRSLAAIPLIGEAYNISITEKMQLNMAISPNGDNYIQEAKGEGSISLHVYLTGDEIENARDLYRKKGQKYKFSDIDNDNDNDNDEFDLGRVSVTASPYVDSDFGQQTYLKQRIPSKDSESRAWYEAICHKYKISPEAIYIRTDVPKKVKRALLWVRPVLEEFKGGHILRLEFDIHNNDNHDMQDWRYDDPDEDVVRNPILNALSNSTLQTLSLKVNTDDLPFPNTSDPPIVESWGRVSRKRDRVEWRDIAVADLLEHTQSTDYEALTRYPLRVVFSRPLTELKTHLEISFKLLVDTAISGTDIKPSHFWLPNGQVFNSTDSDFIKRETHLSGTLTVTPVSFAYQHETTTPETIASAPGIPLTSGVINNLVAKLEQKHQIYVKSVIKSTPITESQDKFVYQKRSWNILGRFYTQHNHPVDVYVLLISRTPLGAVGKTIIWGNVTCRALQMDKGKDISAEMAGRCKKLREDLQKTLQPEEILPQWQTVVPRVLGRI